MYEEKIIRRCSSNERLPCVSDSIDARSYTPIFDGSKITFARKV